jgi:hypothetical protein
MSKAWLKRVYEETEAGDRLLGPFVRARAWWAGGGWRSDRAQVVRDFRRVFGRAPDLLHPKTLNEKLAWMKLHVRDSRQTVAADKAAVRELVARAAGREHLVPLLGTWRRAEEVPFGELPEAFVLKVNHGSGQNLVVRDKAALDVRKTRLQLRRWLRANHYAASREWPYRDIEPRIVAEVLLADGDGRLPEDYKFHCFGGRAEFIQVDLDRETAHRRNFYDREWNLLPFLWCEVDGAGGPAWPNGRAVAKPVELGEMIALAEKLAAPWPYVRIDLFNVAGKILFGEITFYHGSGLEPFFPAEVDAQLGAFLPKFPVPQGMA